MFLSPRQQSILNRVVDTYIETGQPVGSKAITKLYTELYRHSYSTATVRHEMCQLEEKGYLTHPHTSAGRIPTDTGYRYYIDHSLRMESLSYAMLEKVKDGLFFDSSSEMEMFAQKASLLLSDLAEEVSMVLLHDFTPRKRYDLFIRGTERILHKPEFDKHTIGSLLKIFEEKRPLIKMLGERHQLSGVKVSIGKENQAAALNDCTVVSADIYTHGEKIGTLAVLGPTRMRYSKNVPVVSYMAQMMSGILDRN